VWRAFVALALLATTIAAVPSQAGAQDAGAQQFVTITVENLQPDDGFFFTPVWTGLHNGDFDLFTGGEGVTPGLQVLAETGATGDLSAEFQGAGRLDTTVGGGPIAPGATVEGQIEVINAANYQYLSFASMLIPSNDAFFGNSEPDAYQLFDDAGEFTGAVTIDIFTEDIYDAGTEDNTASGAAGFSLGLDGTGSGPSTATTPRGVAAIHPDQLSNIVGIQTAAGTTIGSAGSGFLDAAEPIARITIYVGARQCGGEDVTVDLSLGQEPTEEGDVILGTDGDDVINGLGGNDIICGEGGNDTINAGIGRDTVFGGSGADFILAGPGRDTVWSQGGDDFVSGGRGMDTINGGAGDDDLRGNNGFDTINGGAGDDKINGGQRADTLKGDNGNDTIVGGTRPDVIDGGNGNDTIDGGGSLSDVCVPDDDDESVTNCELEG